MKKKNQNISGTAFMVLLLGSIAILAFTSYYFLNRLGSSYVMMSNGRRPIMRVTNPYKYQTNFNGLIFSGMFMVAGIFVMIMIALPKDEKQKIVSPPAPVSIDEDDEGQEESLQEESSAVEKSDKPTGKSKGDVGDFIITETVENIDPSLIESEGESDVIYGTGLITDEATIDFVHKYPDSAIKFLYNKTLEGKPLSMSDSEIYKSWERRGMRREKIMSYILNLMDWKNLPDENLQEIWVQVRDQIYEMTH